MPKRALFTSSFLVAAVTFSQLSTAQDEDFDLSDLAIEEIIVTAQKKTESIQDVPVSMTAMGADALDASGTTHFKDLSQMNPGLYIEARAGSGFGTQIRMRGIGTPPFNATLPPAVGIFIDDVAQGSLGAALAELPDIERIEILRGPQGTLYGKNVPAGAISYITKRPENDVFEGKLEGTIGNYGYGNVKGSVNLPVIEDVLGVRVSAYHTQKDGYADVFISDQYDASWKKIDAPETKSTGGRMRIGYVPVSEFEAILTLEHFVNDYNDFRDVVEYSTAAEEWRQIHNKNNPAYPDGWPAGGPAVPEPIPDDYKQYVNLETIGTGRVQNAALHLEWELNDEYLAKSITSYQYYKDDFGGDADGSALNTGELIETVNTTDTFSQELRLEFSGEVWEYLAGLYFSHLSVDTLTKVHIDVIRGIAVSIDLNIHNIDKETDSFGAFFHNTFNLTDDLIGTIGVRYSKDDLSTWQSAQQSVYLTGQPPSVAEPFIFDDETTYEAWSGTGKLSYYLNEDVLLYTSYDVGYKHGGFNEVSIRPGFEHIAPTFDKETSDNIEVGFKSTMWDSRFRLNGTVFYQTFDDYQVVVPEGSQGTAIVRAADVTTQGLEMEFAVAVSAEFLVGGAVTYTDATYDNFEGAPCTPDQKAASGVGNACTQDLSGEKLNNNPPWSLNVNATYTRTMDQLNGGEWFTRVDMIFRDENLSDPTADKRSLIDSYTMFNLRGGIFLDSGFNASLWVKNLTDEHYFTDLSWSDLGVLVGQTGTPRSYGLTVGYQF